MSVSWCVGAAWSLAGRHTSRTIHICSRHVVTAAHCLTGRSPPSLGVALGYTDLAREEEEGRVLGVLEMVQHPAYEGEQTNHQADLAVLTLDQEVDLSLSARIKPVCLPPSGGLRPEKGWYYGQPALVSGWGLTDFFYGTFPTRLRQVEVTVQVAWGGGRGGVVQGEECGRLSQLRREGQFCAGGAGK